MSKMINCIVVDDEPIAREIIETHLSRLDYVNILDSCSNAFEAFNSLNKYEVDLLFLDINMPDVSGLTFAKAIGDQTKIIFTTAYREYAVEGFELAAVDYLLKPITFEKIVQALIKYKKIKQPKAQTDSTKDSTENQSFFVRSDRKMVRVNYEDILYLESYSDYVKIHTTGQTIVTRELISRLENELPKKYFIRIHRSYIIAINKVKAYTNESVEIAGKELTISRSYKEEVIATLG